MKINMNNIVNPREAIPGIIKKLFPFYIKDYGYEYKDMILHRLYNTIYIFDSNPKEVWSFILKYKDDINDSNFISRSKREYKDYILNEEEANTIIEKNFRKYLKRHFGIVPSEDVFAMDIDFDSYSSKNKEHLLKGSKEEKELIATRQENYKKQCFHAGFHPFYSDSLMDELANYQRSLIDYKKRYLIRNTKWAHRIKKEVHDLYHFDIDDEVLKENLFDEVSRATTGLEKDKKSSRTVIFCPIIHNVPRGNVDRILFHELRHAIETSTKGTGIYTYRNSKYNMINEIHTEKDAILDAARLEPLVFFAKSRRIPKSYYEKFFPYLGSLFEDYKMTFDYFSLLNRPDLLEECLGDSFLEDLEYKLHHEEEFKKDDHIIRVKRNIS